MPVDVLTETIIDRPVREVASYVTDPSSATEWYANIKQVDWKTAPPAQLGSRVAFVAKFLGRTLEYTYEFVDLVPGQRVVMRTEQGPFPMETTYEWSEAGAGKTRMTLRNRGEPSGFGKLMGTVMAPAMRRANTADLKRLKSILESRSS